MTVSSSRHPVFVHIGEAKTGTTYLQNLLNDNRDALRADGLLYPNCGGSGHVLEVLDLRRVRFKGSPDPNIAGSWDRLVAEIRAWDGPALISSELLSPSPRDRIDHLMLSLDFADVHVVFTMRDLARQLPAAWQEWVKNCGQESFEHWLAAIHDPENYAGDAGRAFWKLHDTAGILTRWAAGRPPEQVHVVTVPPAGGDPSLLWKRFARVIGVDPDRYRYPEGTVYGSLGAAEVSVVRDVNIALGGNTFPWRHYDRYMKWCLSTGLLARRGAPIDLPPAEYEWAVAKSQEAAKAIADAGYDVIGDLDDLLPTGRPSGLDPDDVPGDLRADAGVAGITRLIHRLVDEGTEVERLRAQLAASEATVREHRELPPRERVKRCLVELSEQIRWLGVLRRGYTKLRRGGAAAHPEEK
jgi:hypothetical protein